MKIVRLALPLLLILTAPSWTRGDEPEPDKEKPKLKLFGTFAGLYENNQTSDLIEQGGEYDKGKALLSHPFPCNIYRLIALQLTILSLPCKSCLITTSS